MDRSVLPLLADYEPERIFAWRDGNAVTCGRVLSDMRAITRHLQPNRPCINLCEERYLFIAAFAAVGLVGGVNMLPQSRAPDTLAMLRQEYPDALTIDDEQVAAWLMDAPVEIAVACPALAAGQCMALMFTSGSTGQPSRHHKAWGDLVLGADLYQRRFFAQGQQPVTVATVPPRHMYGLETSVMPALQLGFVIDTGRPFMPWAIAEALARLPGRRLLITTPVHMQACFDAGVDMPEMDLVISATAPLDVDLARAVEAAWQCPVHEIYGSTETGSVASRRTTETDVWSLYDDMSVTDDNGIWLRSPQLAEPFPLSDNIEILDRRHFRLLGRGGDMLKVAGKRMSLNELTRHLSAMDGVDDAVVFNPGADDDSTRPAALVVAPTLTTREISARLAHVVDAVFVPRPLLRVDALPRNDLGKLPRHELLALLRQVRQR